MLLNPKLDTLRTLDWCGGYLLPEDTLLEHLLLAHPRASRTDLLKGLRDLEALGLVVSLPDSLGGPHRWGLTDEGAAELRKRRL